MKSAATAPFTLGSGEHACLFYDAPAEQLPVLIPYLREGLVRGERCIYVSDDLDVAAVSDAIAAAGIDLPGATDRGALQVWTRLEWRQPGALDSARKAAQVRALIDEALASGFGGVRLAIEMTWTLDPDVDADALAHWEATLDGLSASGLPVRVSCQYNLHRLSAAALHAALRTHRRAAAGEGWGRNPYFEAPLILGGDGAANRGAEDARIDWMLAQLRAAESLEEERVRRARALSQRRATRVRRRNAQLRALASEAASGLQTANTARDEFLGHVSHELRTPVATILGSAQALRRGGAGLEDADRAAAVLAIEQEALRLGRTLDDIFVLASVEDAAAFAVEPVLLRRLVQEQIGRHRSRHPGRRIQFTSDPREPPVGADPLYLRQILANLLDHVEYHAAALDTLEVECAAGGDHVAVRVIDRSSPIPADEAEQLFMPFYRSPRAAGPGIGAGLAAARRLVEAHGGRIWTRPREGGGTELGFSLPVADGGDDDVDSTARARD